MDIENILVCSHSFFKLSTVRRELYAEVCLDLEQDVEFFIKHVSSRWLTAGPAIDRVIKHYSELKEFIETTLPKADAKINQNPVWKKLSSMFQDSEGNLGRLQFASQVASKHQKFCLKFQTEKPVIPFLMKDACSLLTGILSTIVDYHAIPSDPKSLSRLNIDDLVKKSKIHVDFGFKVNESLSSLKVSRRISLESEFTNATIVDAKYIQKHLNIGNECLQALSSFDPCNRKNMDTKKNMLYLASLTNRFSSLEMNLVEEEINIYIRLLDEEFPVFRSQEHRLDTDFYIKIWAIVEDRLARKPESFIKLCKLVLGLSHGQSSIERDFRYFCL